MQEPSDVASHQHLHEQVLPKLAGAVDGSVVLDAEQREHAESCLQCQAELVRYRKLLRALHDLRTTVIRPTPGMLADILDNLAEKGEKRAVHSLLTGRRVAYAGGIAIAAVAGTTGAILLAGRSRKGKSAA